LKPWAHENRNAMRPARIFLASASRTNVAASNPASGMAMEDEMERSRLTALTAGVALAVFVASGATAFAQTTQPKQAAQSDTASMVKPPESASGSGGSSNPDNMPIKRPRHPTNDKMMHEPPASGANAK